MDGVSWQAFAIALVIFFLQQFASWFFKDLLDQRKHTIRAAFNIGLVLVLTEVVAISAMGTFAYLYFSENIAATRRDVLLGMILSGGVVWMARELAGDFPLWIESTRRRVAAKAAK